MSDNEALEAFLSWDKTVVVHPEVPRQQAFVGGYQAALAHAREIGPCGHPKICEGMALDGKSCGWCADIADLHVIAGHLSKIYDYMTNGKITKPMTLPSVVISEHEDLDLEDWAEREAEIRRDALRYWDVDSNASRSAD